MNVVEQRGYFWWSNEPLGERQTKPNRHMAGVLKITNKGRISLKLDAPLMIKELRGKKLIMNAEGINLEGKSICGLLDEKNEKVYLTNLWGGFLFEQFEANDCLIGRENFPFDLKDPLCGEFGIHLDGYESWLCLAPVNHRDDTNEISFTYKIPDEDNYETPDANIRISYHPSWTCGNNATLTPTAYFQYRLKTPTLLRETAKKFRLIEDLFILLTDSEYCMKQPTLTLSQNDKKYTYYFSRNANDAESPGRHECPTNFVLLRPAFGEILSLWEQKSAVLGSAFYSYLSTKRGMMLYIEDQFKNLVGGLETFHRKTVLDQPLDVKIQNKIHSVLNQIAPKDRKWAKLVLKRAHVDEPTLGARLYDVFEKIRPDLDRKKLRSFADACAKDRNDLAHFAGQRDTNDNTLFYKRLIISNDTLAYLYHALILSEIGVKKEIIDGWANNSFCAYRIKRTLVEAGLLDKPALELPTPLPSEIPAKQPEAQTAFVLSAD